MSILEHVERSLESFRPKNRREFVALQIAQRFSDTRRLAAYLNACGQHASNVLLETARFAQRGREESGQPVADIFFELLDKLGKESAT